MNSTPSKLATVARFVLGSIFVVFGLNGFLHFLPLLKATEVTAGALLLAGYVPIALTLLAPIIVNITAFHLFLAPGNYAVVALVLAAEGYLAFVHRAAFAPLFTRRGAKAKAGSSAKLEIADSHAA